jgi:3-hydroxybutyryl-CoA dehydrogenase
MTGVVRLDGGVNDPPDIVAVLGAGDEACGLAHVAALAGCAVRLCDPDHGSLTHAVGFIRAAVESDVASGRIAPDDRQRVLDHILVTSDLEEAVTHAELVILALGPADGHAPLLARLAELCLASTVVALGTDNPGALTEGFPQPGRVLGLGVPLQAEAASSPSSDLAPVDIVPTPHTAPHAVERARHFARRLGRSSILR